jgi:hypothetical protein
VSRGGGLLLEIPYLPGSPISGVPLEFGMCKGKIHVCLEAKVLLASAIMLYKARLIL